jgi:hypothetical protein
LFVFGIGLFFFLIRMLQINPFNFGMRIWLWLSLLALGVAVVYFFLDFRLNYGREMKEFEARQQRQQYLRTSTTAAGARLAGPGAPLVSGARPVKRRRK